jgi:hypothetical protein
MYPPIDFDIEVWEVHMYPKFFPGPYVTVLGIRRLCDCPIKRSSFIIAATVDTRASASALIDGFRIGISQYPE